MACEFAIGDGVVYCVWGRPTTKDMDQVLHHVSKTAEMTGSPVIYITRVPVEAPAPDAKVRNYLNSLMPQIIEHCSSYHVVLEGAGFTAALKRGVLVSLFQVGRRRNMFHVHATPDEAVRCVAPERQIAVRALLIRADARGMLRGAPPTSSLPLPLEAPAGYQKTSGVRSTDDFLAATAHAKPLQTEPRRNRA